MSFAAPAMLGFAALLPAILVLYFLKLRRVPRVVSSTYLWKRAVDEYRVNRPFQRFQNQLLLWLQLLLLALLILGLSRPYVDAEQTRSGVHIYLLDHSASMNTREEGGTRLDLAKKLLRDAVGGKRGSDQMMIVAFSDRAFVAAPMTTEKDALLRALDQIPPTERPTRLEEAWRTALSVARRFDGTDVYLVSDGGFGPLEALTQANATVHYVPIGKSANNLGVVHLEARESAEDKGVKEIFARVTNRRRDPATARVELLVNDRLVDAQDARLAAGETKGLVFRRRFSDEGVAEVRLPAGDAFPADDRAWVSLRASEPARVLLVGESDVFLEQALANDPDVDLSRLTPAAYAPLEGRLPPSDLVVFDGVSPRSLPKSACLCLGAAPALEGFESGPPAENPRLLKWDLEHPLLRFVNFSTLNVSKLVTGAQPPWMRPLLTSDRGAAIAAGEQGGTRLVLVRFPLLESDWPLRVSFPLFISNLVRWARDVEVRDGPGFTRPGEPLVLAAPAGSASGTLRGPGLGERSIEPGADRRVTVADAERPGVYRVRWEGRKADAVHLVNLLDAQESAVEVPREVAMGASPLLAKDERALVRRELAPWFLGAALALLLAEWLCYQLLRG